MNVALLTVGACAEDPAASVPPGGRLALEVAPLSLVAVTDATYGVTVRNGLGQVVWSVELTSSQFGDSAGSIAYVGPCDASPGAEINSVELVLVELRDASGVLTDGVDYVNPAPSGAPYVRVTTCRDDEDVRVTIDLTVARNARQGFFDIAVTLEDVFCSAKIECVHQLLHHPHTGQRDLTLVAGFACTAGPGADTHLAMDEFRLDCDGGGPYFVDVHGGPGQLSPPFPGPPNTTELLYQAAVFRGVEQLSDGEPLAEAYWNVAMGLNEDAFATLGACNLTGAATVSDGPLPNGTAPDGYPYVTWNLPITNTLGANVCQFAAPNLLYYPTGVGVVHAPAVGKPFFADFARATQEVVQYGASRTNGACVGDADCVTGNVCHDGECLLEDGAPCIVDEMCLGACVARVCDGGAALPLAITPDAVTTTIGGTQLFSATGGTPPYTYSVVSGGGSVVDATYTAPLSTGTATVRVTDGVGGHDDAVVTIENGWVLGSNLGGALFNDRLSWIAMRPDGAGGFVALAYTNGALARSMDGQDWSIERPVPANRLRALATNGALWIAVGEQGAVLSSTDLSTWTVGTSGTTSHLYGLDYGGGRWVAVGAAGTILTSTDGASWEIATSGTLQTLSDVAYDGGTWVVVGSNGTILTSSDGLTWGGSTSGTASFLSGVTRSANGWVAVGSSGTLLTAATPSGSWTARSTPTTAFLQKVAAGGGRTLVVGIGTGVILTSTDDVSWTLAPSGSAVTLHDAAFAGSTWAVGGDGGALLVGDASGSTWDETNPVASVNRGAVWSAAVNDMTVVAPSSGGLMVSEDVGASWIWVALDGTPYAAAYSGGTWVAVGLNGRVWTSPDALSWTARASATSSTLNSVVSNGSLWVAVGDGGTIVTAPPDGVTWTARSSGATASFKTALWAQGRFIVAGNGGTIRTSTNGTTWTVVGSPTTYPIHDMAFNGSLWVATVNDYAVLTSTDGTSWFRHSTALPTVGGVAWNGARWVVVTSTVGWAQTSPDGTSWTLSAVLGRNFYDVVSVGGQLLATGDLGTIVTSPDGASWTSTEPGGTDYVHDLAYLSSLGRWIAGSNQGLFHYSDDRANWTAVNRGLGQQYGLACSTSLCVAVGGGGALHTSTDGVSWTPRTSGTTGTLYAVAWSGTTWVAVGSGRILTSSDAVTWAAQTVGTATVTDVAWSGSRWALVGSGGLIMTSTDGTSWSPQVSGTTATLTSIAWNGGGWVVGGTQGTILTGTADGSSWTPRVSGTSDTFQAAAWDGARWVLGGTGRELLVSSDGVSWAPMADYPLVGFDLVTTLRFAAGTLAVAGSRGTAFVGTLTP